jgi:hypothetical protein
MPDTKIPKGKRVRIRMYRQGLGDCFLLSFYLDGEPMHILVDCGVLTGTPGGKKKIRSVAESIRDETGGKLNVLVATHEHWDHVSGFYDAKDIFDGMKIDEIWTAWTEDPQDPVARDMKRDKAMKLQAIHLALAELSKSEVAGRQAYGQAISELLGFYGGPVKGATLMAFSEKTAEAMSAVTKRDPSPTFWKPGDLIVRSWLPGIRIYVLAPPLDPSMLKKEQGKEGTETYGLVGAHSAFSAALEALLSSGGEPLNAKRDEREKAFAPFHPSLQWPDLDDPHFKQLRDAYSADDSRWRRIDQDWLLTAGRLALQLDGATNNTSLVLAIEFEDTKEVLLFPADAQIGSWKSWSTVKWKVGDGNGGTREIDSTDLLRRTVFYKVGHHGSHNATLKENGLELMTSPGFVAAIPVDQEFANNSKHWEMPAEALFSRLQELARSRILRADTAWPMPTDQSPSGLTQKEWKQFKESVRLDQNGLFIDFFI